MTIQVSVRANRHCFLITTLILQRLALPFSLEMASDVDMDVSSDSDSSTSIDKLIQQFIDERR
jgi:hypothetical protein